MRERKRNCENGARIKYEGPWRFLEYVEDCGGKKQERVLCPNEWLGKKKKVGKPEKDGNQCITKKIVSSDFVEDYRERKQTETLMYK